MKLLISFSYGVIFLFVELVISLLCQSCDIQESAFKKFMQRFNKSYDNDTQEYTKRLEYFRINHANAEKLNHTRKDNYTAWFGVTKFSDLSFEEFNEKFLSDYIPSQIPHASFDNNQLLTLSLKEPRDFSQLPKHVDWRDHGHVTKVKDQKGCGGCWAFSSIVLMESQFAAQTGKLDTFSEQEILDCSRTKKTPYGSLYGCKGGQLCAALYWLNETKTTVVRESAYKYQDDDRACKMFPKLNSGIWVEDYQCNNYIGQEEAILQYLATHGPVAVAVDASNWHNYLGGIIQYHCETKLNHAVVIVGYDLTGPVPYYIVRNSWGPDWGHEGYMYVKYNENVCGIATEVTMVKKVGIV